MKMKMNYIKPGCKPFTNAIAFTGHRPQAFPWREPTFVHRDEPRQQGLRLQEAEEVTQTSTKRHLDKFVEIVVTQENSVRNFIVGGALGVDTWALESILKCKEKHPEIEDIQVLLAIPHPQMPNKWSPAQRAHYFELIQQEDAIHFMRDHYGPSNYFLRNEYMVDHASRVIAVWNGQRHGGTYHCIQYAKFRNVPVHRLDWDYERGRLKLVEL